MERLGDALSKAIDDARAASEVLYDEAAELRDRERDARAHRHALLEEAAPSVTTEDLVRLRLGTEEPTHALRVVRAWWGRLEDPGFATRVLVLLGGTGCGKTVAASWALSRERGRYITTERLLLVARSRRPEHLAEYDATMRAKARVVTQAEFDQWVAENRA